MAALDFQDTRYQGSCNTDRGMFKTPCSCMWKQKQSKDEVLLGIKDAHSISENDDKGKVH